MEYRNSVVEQFRAIVSAGGSVNIPRKGFVEVKGSRTIGPLAAAFLAGKADPAWYDEVSAIVLGGMQHDADTLPGRLARNLLKWYRGDKVQVDPHKHRVDTRSMATQIYTQLRTEPANDPSVELLDLVRAFRAIVDGHEWQDRVVDWPTVECVVSAANPEEPNKNIKFGPPPGYVRGTPPAGSKKSLYEEQ